MSKICILSLFSTQYLGVRILASCLKEKGHEVQILTLKEQEYTLLDVHDENINTFKSIVYGIAKHSGITKDSLSDEDLACFKEFLLDFNPDVIAVSAFTEHKALIPKLMSTISSIEKNYLKVVGGIGATIEPEFFLDAGFDLVLRGEGEETIVEVADFYNDKERLYKILNTVYKVDGQYISNPLRAQCQDLSNFPSALYGDAYVSHIENGVLYKNKDVAFQYSTRHFLLGRGCIGKCTYCCEGHLDEIYKEQKIKTYKYRNRSLDSIFNEFKNMDLTQVRMIQFVDDLFFGPIDYMKEFFIRYKNEVNIPFFLYLKYDLFLENDELFNLAIDAGLQETSIGIQSGCEEFTKKYYNRHYKNQLYVDFAKKTAKHHVRTRFDLIGGNCYETDDVFFKTIDVIQSIPFEILSPEKIILVCFKLYTFPKTKILKLYPDVTQNPMPTVEWYRRGLLYELSKVLSKEEVVELFYNQKYKDNISALENLRIKTYKEKCIEAINEHKEKWKDKDIVIYGAGNILQNSYHLFKEFNPKAILLDKEFLDTDVSRYNLPSYEASEYLAKNPNTHIIIPSLYATLLSKKACKYIKAEQILEYTLVKDPELLYKEI